MVEALVRPRRAGMRSGGAAFLVPLGCNVPHQPPASAGICHRAQRPTFASQLARYLASVRLKENGSGAFNTGQG
jgi:hypothetical protein